MKIGLFLGAGASAPYQKPTTDVFLRQLYSKGFDSSFHDFLLKSLLDVNYFKDIEYVIQAVNDIILFSDTIGYQFFLDISKNQTTFRHTMVVHGGNSYTIEQVVEEIKYVEKTLKEKVFEYYSWKGYENILLQRIYDTIFHLLETNSEHVKIFTTNYDQAIETYCELVDKLRLVDGFKYHQDKQHHIWANGDFTYYDNLADKTNVYLYKLHGSLNWKEHTSKWLERTSEESIAQDPKYPNNMLIYPTLSPKDGIAKEPYKSIFRNFEDYMKVADACIAIGYSFRDEEINNIFKSFLKNQKTLVVISPSSMKVICENFLKISMPEGYDKSKSSSLAPYNDGYIWCLPDEISEQNVKFTFELAITHAKTHSI